MTITTNYTQLRTNLAKYLNDVTENRDIVVIERKDREKVAMIAADELSSLLETAYLLQSPKNAGRLLSALGRALKNEGELLSLEALRVEVGFEPEGA